MVDVIINAIGGRALLIICGVLLAVCVGLGMSLQTTNALLDAAQSRQDVLGEKLRTQNSAVRKWKAAAEEQAEKVRQAAQQREKVRVVTVERVREITVAAVPAPCPEAVRWAADQAVEFNRRWEAGE